MKKRLITYYQKERIIKFISLLVMGAFLVINLFPIFWMVFCSFKNNNDILSGNVGFSRVQTDISSFYEENDFFYVFSIDGTISKYSKSDKKFINKVTVKGHGINYTVDSNYIYFAVANKGLYKIDKNSLKILKHPTNPITNVDSNKIGNASLVLAGENIYYTVEFKGLSNIYVYDRVNLKPITDKPVRKLAFDDNAFIRSMYYSKPYIYIGTDSGVAKYNPRTGNIIKFISFGNDYYPSGLQKIIKISNNVVSVATQYGVYQLDMKTGVCLNKSNFGLPIFEDVYVKNNKMYVANQNGLAIIDLNKNIVVATYKGLVKELSDGVVVNHKTQFNSDEISTVLPLEKELLLGSSFGRISFMRESEGKPYGETQLPLGYKLVKVSNYEDLWKNIDFGLYLRNSVIISGFTMIFSMILATLASYALVRYKFKGNKEFGIAILSTQMIPQIMYLIPLFIMFKWMTDVTHIQIKGTFTGLIFIYTAFFVPFSIWILRSFFSSIPVELEESARIDGCNGFQVFWKIALPLAIPGIIATGIYIFLTAWDELMFAWVLTNSNTMTIPIGIRLFVGNFQNRYDLMMAAATVATIPVLVLFFMLQKHIVKGLTAGAVKG